MTSSTDQKKQARINIQQQQPEAYNAMFSLEHYLGQSALAKPLQEMVRLRASIINKCEFCIKMHGDAAKQLSVADNQLNAIYEKLTVWQDHPLFTPQEQHALQITDSMTLLPNGGITDDLYYRTRQLFNEDQMAQLIMLIATINAWNRIGVSMAERQ